MGSKCLTLCDHKAGLKQKEKVATNEFDDPNESQKRIKGSQSSKPNIL